jgi:molybdate transport system regulatory protein
MTWRGDLSEHRSRAYNCGMDPLPASLKMKIPPALKIKIQVMCGAEIAMGPGKAALLNAITREGSISAAARAMGMSYRRAWMLVDTMNRCFVEPLVATDTVGARVTGAGVAMLDLYRGIEARADDAARDKSWAEMAEALRAQPLEHQAPPKA